MRRCLARALVAALPLSACTLFTSYEGLTGGGLTAEDGAPPDASALDAPAEGAPARPDAGPEAGLVAIRRIRCGVPSDAPPYTDSEGNPWTGDVDFDVGQVVSNSDAITETNDPLLYRSERYADRFMFPSGFRYTFDGLEPGAYVLKLHFVEASSATIFGPDQRRFDVLVDDAPILNQFDIFAEAGGRRRALVKTFTVNVTGASLVVRFVPGSVQNPKINAIEVLR